MQRNGVTPDEPRVWDVWTVPGQFETLERELQLAADPVHEMGASAGTQLTLQCEFDGHYGFPGNITAWSPAAYPKSSGARRSSNRNKAEDAGWGIAGCAADSNPASRIPHPASFQVLLAMHYWHGKRAAHYRRFVRTRSRDWPPARRARRRVAIVARGRETLEKTAAELCRTWR